MDYIIVKRGTVEYKLITPESNYIVFFQPALEEEENIKMKKEIKKRLKSSRFLSGEQLINFIKKYNLEVQQAAISGSSPEIIESNKKRLIVIMETADTCV